MNCSFINISLLYYIIHAFGNRDTNFVRTLPSFQDRMETDVSLLHENSLCFYNLFGFFFFKAATRYLPLYLLCFQAEAVPEPTR